MEIYAVHANIIVSYVLTMQFARLVKLPVLNIIKVLLIKIFIQKDYPIHQVAPAVQDILMITQMLSVKVIKIIDYY